MTDDDPVLTEITQLQEQIKERTERIGTLRKLRSHPCVVPVMHYWRHYQKYDEPGLPILGDTWDLLRGAYATLSYMSDDGQCSPEGVSIGGAMFTMSDLHQRYGRIYE